MSTLTIASSEQDGRAVEQIQAHHAELIGSLELHVQVLHGAIASGGSTQIERSRSELVAWCRTQLAPHAQAEEDTLYPAAAMLPGATLLMHALTREHTLLRDIIDRLARSDDPIRMAADAGALQALFSSHVAKENELVLPAVAADPATSLSEVAAQLHQSVEQAADSSQRADAAHGHQCGCHEASRAEVPELDARSIPHAIRHATIFGALEALAPGTALVLVAPHDPLPLLAQIEQRWPGRLDVDYLDRGPQAWRLRFTRTAG